MEESIFHKKMNVGSAFDPISVKLNNPPKELNLKIFTYKGIVDIIPYKQLDRVENYETVKERVRNLEPNKYFDNPYWELYHLVKPTSMRVENDQSETPARR